MAPYSKPNLSPPWLWKDFFYWHLVHRCEMLSHNCKTQKTAFSRTTWFLSCFSATQINILYVSQDMGYILYLPSYLCTGKEVLGSLLKTAQFQISWSLAPIKGSTHYQVSPSTASRKLLLPNHGRHPTVLYGIQHIVSIKGSSFKINENLNIFLPCHHITVR